MKISRGYVQIIIFLSTNLLYMLFLYSLFKTKLVYSIYLFNVLLNAICMGIVIIKFIAYRATIKTTCNNKIVYVVFQERLNKLQNNAIKAINNNK